MIATSEQLVAVRGGIGYVSRSVVALAEADGYSVVASGPGTFRLARKTRPTWARVATWALFPLLGLGLLFLLVRRAEEATVSVFEDRDGTKIRIVGLENPALVGRFRTPELATSAEPASMASWPLRSQAAPATNPAVIAQVPGASGHAPAPTERPSAAFDPSQAHLSAHAAAEGPSDFGATVIRPSRRAETEAPRLHLPDGSVFAAPGVVVGRLPSRPPELASLAPIRIDDQSVSKTHAAIEIRDRAILVTDLHSTNGTLVIHGASATLCEPGRATPVPAGASIQVGEAVIRTSGAS